MIALCTLIAIMISLRTNRIYAREHFVVRVWCRQQHDGHGVLVCIYMTKHTITPHDDDGLIITAQSKTVIAQVVVVVVASVARERRGVYPKERMSLCVRMCEYLRETPPPPPPPAPRCLL